MAQKIAGNLKDKKKSEDFAISETMINYFVRILDLLALLDALKNMKANLNNDFSFYKRSFSLLRNNMHDDQSQENNTLYLFLANPHSITTNLKNELLLIDGYVYTSPHVTNKESIVNIVNIVQILWHLLHLTFGVVYCVVSDEKGWKIPM